jgi:hypothetical protein
MDRSGMTLKSSQGEYRRLKQEPAGALSTSRCGWSSQYTIPGVKGASAAPVWRKTKHRGGERPLPNSATKSLPALSKAIF